MAVPPAHGHFPLTPPRAARRSRRDRPARSAENVGVTAGRRDQRRAQFPVQVEHEFHDGFAGGEVEVERRHVLDVLRQEKGNKVHAARKLGISPPAVTRAIGELEALSTLQEQFKGGKEVQDGRRGS